MTKIQESDLKRKQNPTAPVWVRGCGCSAAPGVCPEQEELSSLQVKVLFWVLCRWHFWVKHVAGVCSLILNSKPWHKGTPASLSLAWCFQQLLITCWPGDKPGPSIPCRSLGCVLVVYFIITAAGNGLFLFLKLLDICSSFNVNNSSLSLSFNPMPILLFSSLLKILTVKNPDWPKPLQAILSPLLQDEAQSIIISHLNDFQSYHLGGGFPVIFVQEISPVTLLRFFGNWHIAEAV